VQRQLTDLWRIQTVGVTSIPFKVASQTLASAKEVTQDIAELRAKVQQLQDDLHAKVKQIEEAQRTKLGFRQFKRELTPGVKTEIVKPDDYDSGLVFIRYVVQGTGYHRTDVVSFSMRNAKNFGSSKVDVIAKTSTSNETLGDIVETEYAAIDSSGNDSNSFSLNATVHLKKVVRNGETIQYPGPVVAVVYVIPIR
jgi:hypothetical protein